MIELIVGASISVVLIILIAVLIIKKRAKKVKPQKDRPHKSTEQEKKCTGSEDLKVLAPIYYYLNFLW